MTDRLDHSVDDAATFTGTLVRQLENLQPGSHLCAIYGSPDEELRMLVPFLQAGIVKGEQCLYIADDANFDDLRAQGIGTVEDLAQGVLVPLTNRESYLGNGRLDPDKMFKVWAELLAAARAAGYVGLRVAGYPSWALGVDIDSELLVEFEARLNTFQHSTGIRSLCLYDRRRRQPGVLRNVLRTHPLAVIDLRLHNNPYYEPAEVVLGEGDVEAARLNWMFTQLQSLTRRDTALVDLGHLALDSVLADLMGAAQALVSSELGFDYVQIFELQPSGDAVRLLGTSAPEIAAVGSVQQLTPDNPLGSSSLGVDRPLIISDWREQLCFTLPAALGEAGVTSSIITAIGVSNDEPLYGMLSVHSREGRMFSENESLYLESVGIFLAYAITAARNASHFRTLVENAPDVIIRFTADLRVAYANPATERVTGTAAESLVGKASDELGIAEPQLRAWELTLRQAWRTGREQMFEATVSTPLGERIFDSRIVPELGPDGDVQSLLSISRDITAQQAAEAERSELYRRLAVQQKQVQDLVGRLARDHERLVKASAAASQVNLTERERHILRLLAAGRTNREIGARIALTTGTVKNQVAQILSKLNATDRTQAAVRAVELGIVESAKEP
jgi:PAS domain S-box-containing protein